jgi:hypothetical protein
MSTRRFDIALDDCCNERNSQHRAIRQAWSIIDDAETGERFECRKSERKAVAECLKGMIGEAAERLLSVLYGFEKLAFAIRAIDQGELWRECGCSSLEDMVESLGLSMDALNEVHRASENLAGWNSENYAQWCIDGGLEPSFQAGPFASKEVSQ